MRSVGRVVHDSLSFLVCFAACSAGGGGIPGGRSGTGGSTGGSMMDAMMMMPSQADTAPSTPPTDTAPPPPTTSSDAAAPSADGLAEDMAPVTGGDGGTTIPVGLRYKDFTCSWVLGITTTHEWYQAGFEQIVDDARWQVTGVESAQFSWANPNAGAWNAPIASPCTMNSKTPDRIVFEGVDSASTTVAQFLPQYVSVINIIKMRYPTVKRIDLMTLTRAPGDMECVGANRSNSSWIKPAQDEAIAMAVEMFPGFVFATPKFEVKSCKDFGLCPHISAAANALVAMENAQFFIAN